MMRCTDSDNELTHAQLWVIYEGANFRAFALLMQVLRPSQRANSIVFFNCGSRAVSILCVLCYG